MAAFVPPNRYVGAELDAAALAEARLKHPAHRFESSHDLGPDERFDTIVALAVIEHVTQPAEWLRGWAHYLAPDGQIIVTTPHATWEPLHGIAAKFRLTSPEAHDEHEVTFDRDSLESTIVAAGLRLVSYRRFLARMNQVALASA